MENNKKNVDGLIQLWAFAECGIGGILHLLKLPFTGIFVGGIAVICISLIAYFSDANRPKLLEALGLVLLIKLTVSPQSPWQAYLAVIFQGYLGWLIFGNLSHFKLKVFFFSVLCLLESGIQKILISLLIYGLSMVKAIDIASKTVMSNLGMSFDGSLVVIVMLIYVSLHLVVGIILGYWIPKMPGQIIQISQKIPDHIFQSKQDISKKATFSPLWISGIIFVAMWCFLWFFLGQTMAFQLLFILLRAIVISLLLIFIISPLIKWYLAKYLSKSDQRNYKMAQIIDQLPTLRQRSLALATWINQDVIGLAKIKYFLLGMLVITIHPISKDG